MNSKLAGESAAIDVGTATMAAEVAIIEQRPLAGPTHERDLAEWIGSRSSRPTMPRSRT